MRCRTISPPTITLALISSAFLSVIAFSKAAGIKTSTFSERSSPLDILSPPETYLKFHCFHFYIVLLYPHLPRLDYNNHLKCQKLQLPYILFLSKVMQPKNSTFPNPCTATVALNGFILFFVNAESSYHYTSTSCFNASC